MTWVAPASASIAADRSPVCAPFSAGWQHCAPTATGPPPARAAMDAISVAGGQISTSDFGSGCIATSASISARSAVSPFIFQFPAASLTRIAMLLHVGLISADRHGKEAGVRQLVTH
jgi:hypothetical protein